MKKSTYQNKPNKSRVYSMHIKENKDKWGKKLVWYVTVIRMNK